MPDALPQGSAYVACVPHVPFLSMQAKSHNQDFWRSYEARIDEFEAFSPELVIAFGADHYSNVHLDRAPTFMIGHAAEAIDDCGGYPGKLDVPAELSLALAHELVAQDFDITSAYSMVVDHGFSNVLGTFFRGRVGGYPVVPVHINCLTEPRPSLRRCRQLGEAVGRWAATLGRRIAFLGSGGLSHSTGTIFPQYRDAPTDAMRAFIVHGPSEGGITYRQWHDGIETGMSNAIPGLVTREGRTTVVRGWDEKFLAILATGDLAAYDGWADADIVREGGAGASEVRTWVAAAAAGTACGTGTPVVDYYESDTSLAVGAGVAHASPPASAG